MGYDIRAYFGKRPPADILAGAASDELEPAEVAYLGRAARSEAAAEFFRALRATEHDGHVSGGGSGRWFTPDQIVDAIEHLTALLRENHNLAQEVKFLASVLWRMERDGREFVYFDLS